MSIYYVTDSSHVTHTIGASEYFVDGEFVKFLKQTSSLVNPEDIADPSKFTVAMYTKEVLCACFFRPISVTESQDEEI